jgi:probable O-glycosylation ligase (exosortase A-associated)
MPIRDILVSTAIFGSLPFCFLKPWIGILVWSWIGYMNPHRLTWGFAHDLPFAQMVAIATLLGLVATREKYPPPSMREVYLLALFSLTMFVSTLFAYYPVAAWEQFDKVWKILLMTFITIIFFQDPKKLRALVWVIALSIGFYGLKGGIYVVRTGGAHNVQGPEGTFIEGNTEIGLALNMILPFLVFLRRETTNPWLRHLLSAIFVFTIIAILGTYSRGAFLGLVVVSTLLFLRSRTKFLAIVLLAIAIPVAMSTLPQKWFGRMETIQTYEKDGSAMGRIHAWHVAYYLAKERPILGFGFRPFTDEMFRRYGYAKAHDGHSIFFQVLAEHGFTGLILYTGLIVSSFLTLRRLKRVSRADFSLQWVYNYSQMLQASLAAYVVCGAFLSLSYFDLFYHLVAITVILKKLVLVYEQETMKTQPLVQPALTPATVP